MATLAILPAVTTRFRTGEIERLWSALKIIVCERAGQLLNGHSRNEGYWRVLPHRYPDNTCFDPELMERSLFLWSRLCEIRDRGGKSHRLSFNATEVWILMLAIRMAKHHDVSHAKKAKPRPTSKKWSRLLEKLDRLQRSARRVWSKSSQSDLYQSYRARWKKHELWIQASYGCLCRQPPIGLAVLHRRFYVQEAIAVAKKSLKENEIQEPSEKELRCLVRLAFREIRRGRYPYSIAEILRGGEQARGFLSYFIQERLRKSGQLQFIQTD